MVSSPAGTIRPLALLLLVFVACSDEAPTETLGAVARHRTFDLGLTPIVATPGPVTSLAVADFDGDGKPDIAAVGSAFGTILFPGKGDGSFGEARTIHTCTEPKAIAAVDYNRDGKLDLVVACQDGAWGLLGAGDGTFPRVGKLQAGDAPSAIATADLDGDGHPDLAIANGGGSDVSVFLSSGHDTLPAFPDSYPSIPRATALLAGDFDGDGKPDLYVTSGTQALTLRGVGGGAFEAGKITTFDRSVAPRAAAASDLDHDGKVDRITVGQKDDEWVSVWFGNGGHRLTELATGQWPGAVTAGDLDGNGVPDLLVGMTHGSAVLSLLGAGDGTFRQAAYAGVRGDPRAIATADLNGDGKLDAVVAQDGLAGLNVLLGEGDGSFRGERPFIVAQSARRVVTGDLDGDGVPDCVVTDLGSSSNRYTVYLGDGAGHFRVASGDRLGWFAGVGVQLVDVNGDGKLDLLSMTGAVVLLGNGDGTFQPPARAASPWVGVRAVGDLDGDGVPDLVTDMVLLGKGDGTFKPLHAVDFGGSPVKAVQLEDLDGDGKLDLVATTGAGLRLLFGKGDGTFEPPRPVEAGANPTVIAVADYDHDGRLDLAVAHAEGADLHVLLGKGARSFSPPVTVAGASGVVKLVASDVDGDGVPDLVMESVPDPAGARRPLVFLVNDGNGTFQPPRDFGLDGDDFALADVDRDGLPDLLFLQHDRRFLRLVRNTSR